MRGPETRRDGGPRRAAALAGVVALVSMMACGTGGQVRTRDALAPVVGRVTVGGGYPRPPGTRIGFLLLPLRNVSPNPIELVDIDLAGRGLGRTVRVVKIEVSPNLGGVHAIWGGAFHTDPPVAELDDGRCHVPVLRPVRGTVIGPGGEARAWVVLEWGEPGRFLVGPHIVSYVQEGSLRRQILQLRYRGIVDPMAKPARLDPSERPCLAMTTLLNPGPSAS